MELKAFGQALVDQALADLKAKGVELEQEGLAILVGIVRDGEALLAAQAANPGRDYGIERDSLLARTEHLTFVGFAEGVDALRAGVRTALETALKFGLAALMTVAV